MEGKYKSWHKMQGISGISYAISMISLYLMIYAELSYTSIIMAVITTLSLITTTTSGLIRAFIGHKMGLKSTKKDWVIVGISLILVTIYFLIKYL
jgi:hypothetical protein